MYPHERSLVAELKDQPFVLLGVNSDSDLELVRERVVEERLNWRSFWNGPMGPGGPIATAWGVTGWPTLFVIDAVTRKKKPKETTRWRLQPTIGPKGAGLSMGLEF